MGLKLEGSELVFVDTAPFIYFFEKHPKYLSFMERFFNDVYEKDIQVFTSIITYMEITTLPARLNNYQLVKKYRDYFTYSQNINLFPIDLVISEQAVRLRAKYKIKTPDAIQLGTAISCGADIIITNDKGWDQISDQPVYTINDLYDE